MERRDGTWTKEADFKEVCNMIKEEKPLLLTSSPPCTTFSPLRRITNPKRDADVVAGEEKLGRERLQKAMRCCKQQAEQGGISLHEHPKGASSWEEPEVEGMVKKEGSFLVQSPMCRFGMKMRDDHGEELHVRKETLWLTNSECIAEELRGVCENVLQGREVHRHVHLIGKDRAKAAQVYPVELVEAILRGLRSEMRKRGQINSVEEMLTGASPDDWVDQEKENQELDELFMDDSSGTVLPAELVRKARAEELDWLRKEAVYKKSSEEALRAERTEEATSTEVVRCE